MEKPGWFFRIFLGIMPAQLGCTLNVAIRSVNIVIQYSYILVIQWCQRKLITGSSHLKYLNQFGLPIQSTTQQLPHTKYFLGTKDPKRLIPAVSYGEISVFRT